MWQRHQIDCDMSAVSRPNSTKSSIQLLTQSRQSRKVGQISLRAAPRRLPFSAPSISLKYQRIVDGRRHGPRLAVSDLFHGAAQDLARARLRQPGDGDRQPEGRDRPDLLANQTDAFLLNVRDRAAHACFEHDEAARNLAFERSRRRRLLRIRRHPSWLLNTSSMPPVERRCPATLIMSSVRLIT